MLQEYYGPIIKKINVTVMKSKQILWKELLDLQTSTQHEITNLKYFVSPLRMQTKDYLNIQGMIFNGLDLYARVLRERKKKCMPEGSRLQVL
jgi:hypothetical protein